MICREIAETHKMTMTTINQFNELWQKIKARPHSLYADKKYRKV